MSRTKISEWSSTAASNTDVGGVNIAEGCPPATINNAIREVMAQCNNWQSGASGDNQTNAGTLTSSGTLAVTGAFTLDGATGTSGQFMTSAGSGATPTWTSLSLGTMSKQNADAVNITGGSINTSGAITGGTVTAATITSSTTLAIGSNWTVVQSGSDIIFKYSGSSKMKIDSSGNLTVVGNITAFGSI